MTKDECYKEAEILEGVDCGLGFSLVRAGDEIERLTAENERLRKELEDERLLKQGWIDEYVKLRDMGEMPED